MLIAVQKSSGQLLSTNGGSFYGTGRPADKVPVISSVPVAVRFYADDLVTRVLLDAAGGMLSFTAQPVAGDTFTIGTTVYTARASLTGAANEVLLGANLNAFIANLTAAVEGAVVVSQGPGTTYGTGTSANAATTAAVSASTVVFTPTGSLAVTTTSSATFASNVLTFTALPAIGSTFTVAGVVYTVVSALTGTANQVLTSSTLAGFLPNLAAAINAATIYSQGPSVTYGAGTVANQLASAAVYGSAVVFTAMLADSTGNSVVTTTTSAHASFGAATLTGGQVLNLDVKPQGEYDAPFTLPTPTFSAPLDPTAGDYLGTLNTNVDEAIALLEPNNPATATLTFTAQPAANATFTVGTTTYTAKSALTGAADEVLLGANLAAFIANLIGAVAGASTGGQAAGTTYGTGTVANTLATAAAGSGSSVVFTATAAGEDTTVPTTTTSGAASFSSATLIYPASTAVEPDSAPLMAQLSWGAAGSPPNRSDEWQIDLVNVVRHPDDGVPTSANGPLTPAVVQTAVNQAAAATAALATLTSEVSALAPVSTPRVAYLETTGNDATAVIGDPAKPFLTAQAAFLATLAGFGPGPTYPFVIHVGATPTNFGGIALNNESNLGAFDYITFVGLGMNASRLGGIVVTVPNGVDAVYDDDNNLVSAATAGSPGGSIGPIYARDVNLGAVAVNGGNGGNDVNGGAAGGGGYGGSVILVLNNAYVMAQAIGGNAGEPDSASGGGGGGVYIYGGYAVINVSGGNDCSGFGGNPEPDGFAEIDGVYCLGLQSAANSLGLAASRSSYNDGGVGGFSTAEAFANYGTFVDQGGNGDPTNYLPLNT